MPLSAFFQKVLCDYQRRTGLFKTRESCGDVSESALERALVAPISDKARYGWKEEQGGIYTPIAIPVVNPPGVTIRPANKLFQNNPVPIGTSPVQLFLDNPNRKEVQIINVSTFVVWLGLGTNPAPTAYDVPLGACAASNDGTGGTYISDIYTGPIWAIAQTAGAFVALKEL